MGNIPGDQQGEVEVWAPNGRHFTCHSGSVTVHAEGIAATLPDGRRLFVTNGGALVIDAPQPQPAPQAETGTGQEAETVTEIPQAGP